MAPLQKTLALKLGTLSFILRTQVGGTENGLPQVIWPPHAHDSTHAPPQIHKPTGSPMLPLPLSTFSGLLLLHCVCVRVGFYVHVRVRGY